MSTQTPTRHEDSLSEDRFGIPDEMTRPPALYDLGDVLFALARIEALLAAQHSAVMDREAAAIYLGISPEDLDRLSALDPGIAPVLLCGRVVWRRADLDSYLGIL